MFLLILTGALALVVFMAVRPVLAARVAVQSLLFITAAAAGLVMTVVGPAAPLVAVALCAGGLWLLTVFASCRGGGRVYA